MWFWILPIRATFISCNSQFIIKNTLKLYISNLLTERKLIYRKILTTIDKLVKVKCVNVNMRFCSFMQTAHVTLRWTIRSWRFFDMVYFSKIIAFLGYAWICVDLCVWLWCVILLSNSFWIVLKWLATVFFNWCN